MNMKKYKVTYKDHDGKTKRVVIVHARNEKEAKKNAVSASRPAKSILKIEDHQ